MGTKKKIAYQLTVDVPESIIKEIIKEAEQRLVDDYSVKVKMKDHEGILASIRKSIQEQLEWTMGDIYAEEVIDDLNLEKLFSAEITAAEEKMAAKEEKEMAAQEKALYATSGVLRLHPTEIVKAMTLLKEAGITVTR